MGGRGNGELDSEVPWGWRCVCGLTLNHEAQFCWSCGKPAIGGETLLLAGLAGEPPAELPEGAGPEQGATTVAAESEPAGTTLLAPVRIVGRTGQVLATIQEGAAGPALCLHGRGGEPVATLCVTAEGGALSLSAPGGAALVVLLAQPDGGYAAVALPSGHCAAELRAGSGGGMVVAYSPEGETAILEARPPGEGPE